LVILRAAAAASVCLGLPPLPLQAQQRVDGVVIDSLRTQAPLAGATVVLVEANRFTTTDARGRFRFDRVHDGRWSLALLHPALDSLDLQLPPVVTEVRGKRTSVTMTTPSIASVYFALCRSARDADAGVIIGRVRSVEQNTPVERAVVKTQWSEFVLGAAGSASRPVSDSARTNADGMYVLCDVPLQTELDVRATRDGQRTGPARVVVDQRIIDRVDLALSLSDGAAREDTLRGRSRVTGRIVNDDATPLADALVIVPGRADTVRSGDDGRFVVDGLPAGTRTLEVRAIGAAPTTVLVDVPLNAVRETVVQVARPGQQLATYTVRSAAPDRSVMAMSGFAIRQQQGLGAFATEAQLRRFNYPTLAAVLQTMRGVNIEYDAKGRPLPVMRGMAGARCIPFFFVDNTPMLVDGASPGPSVQKPFSDIDALVPPLQIKGIEVYANAGGIPPQYDQTALGGCGSIVIWTR